MRILFVVYIRTHFRALLSQAEWLKDNGCDVVFYFATNYRGCLEDAEFAKGVGITAVACNGCEIGKSERPLWCGRKEPVNIPSRNFLVCALKFRDVDRFYHALLARLAPDILVLPEENIGYLCNFLVLQAHQHSVTTVVMPYTIDNPIEAAEAYYLRRRFLVRRGLRRIFARKHPQWVCEHKGCSVFRLPFRPAATMQLMGFAPPDPWKNTCSFSDAVSVECLALGRHHANSGLPLSKLHVVGSCTLDRMAVILQNAAYLKTKLLQELGLVVDQPMFLAAIPPDQFNTQRPGCEFVSHAEVVTFWIDALAATGWNVVVNLHPHLKPEQINLGGHPNVRLCERPVADLIPLCDVFVACISGTIRWAIAAGKPVLNHDLYHYGYDDYRSAPGVVHVTMRDDFSLEVDRMTRDAAYREQLRLVQASVAADWGVLDGRSGERLLGLLEELRQSKTSLAT